MFVGKTSRRGVVYGMSSEKQGHEALEQFIAEHGAPFHMRSDNAQMETSKKWKETYRRYNISSGTTEPHHPQQNYPAERKIQDYKKGTNRLLDRTGAPSHLWFYALLLWVGLLNILVDPVHGKCPEEVATGVSADVSAYMDHTFYDPIYYYDETQSFPSTKEQLGRWLGPALHCGDALTFYVLTENNQVITRSTIRSASDPDTQNHRRNPPFIDEGGNKFLDSAAVPVNSRDAAKVPAHKHDPEDIPNVPSLATPQDAPIVATGQELTDFVSEGVSHDTPTIDPNDLIGYSFVRAHDGTPQRAIVKEQMEKEGKFLVEFVNGGEELMHYNDLINHYNAKEDDGNHFWTYDKILDHRKVNGGKYEVKVLWDTGDSTWEPMELIKEDDKITLAAYARENDLVETAGWKWARRLTKNPKKFIRMAKIFATQSRTHGAKYKYGIQIPKDYEEAVRFDEANGNTLWQDAVKKEMGQLGDFKTFKALKRGAKAPKGYSPIPVKLVFDCKFDLRRKARLVAGGHRTKDPEENSFSGVVSLDNVRTAFFIAELNDLDIMAADVGNAYLHGYTKEKLYTVAGPEFGELEGRILIIIRSLYGLKTSMARWHEALSDKLRVIGFLPSYADPDLWLRDAGDHYEYIAVYSDDLLVFSKRAKEILQGLSTLFPLKGVGQPEFYLGGDVGVIKDQDGHFHYVTSARTYIKNVCDKIEKLFERTLRNYGSPLEDGYHPEIDNTSLLVGNKVSKYMMLIG